jgi:hypothetical protein
MLSRAATFQRYTATLIVALWLLPLLGAIGHSREHAHRFCPEHQAFEETVRGTGQVLSRSSEQTPALAAARATEATDSSRLPHETCPLVTAGTREELLASEAVWVLTSSVAVSPPATAPPQPRSSLPILATAPKSSPPARA